MSDQSSAPMRPILLIEDNEMDIDLTQQAFAEYAVANPIAICRDGEEAIAYIDQHASADDGRLPIVILLDLRLPRVDGLEVLRYARRQPVWQQLPIVVMTTSRENRDIETAYQSGANSYIIKPVDFEAFSEVVKSIKIYWLLTNQPPFPDS